MASNSLIPKSRIWSRTVELCIGMVLAALRRILRYALADWRKSWGVLIASPTLCAGETKINPGSCSFQKARESPNRHQARRQLFLDVLAKKPLICWTTLELPHF